MPHIPDLRSHDAHDLELVAAFAAGDATGPDLETAAALVAGCAECAAVHHDLRAIAAALPALPAPVRPRDFRLTPEQAAAIRPAGWRRLLGALAGPSFRFAAPLGTGLAALGITGILVGSFASVPLGSGAATAMPAERDGQTRIEASGPAVASSPGSGGDVERPVMILPSEMPAPAGSPDQAYAGQASAGTDTAAGGERPEGSGGGGAGDGGVVTGIAGPDAGNEADETPPDAAGDAVTARQRSAGELIGIVGDAALLVGLSLLALRWTSRRLTLSLIHI